MQAASTAVSANSMLPQSPACGVLLSVGVVSPEMASSRLDVTNTRWVVLLLPTMLSAPFT